MLRNVVLIAAGSAIVVIVTSGSGSAAYPLKEVAFLCGAVILEAATLLAVLRPSSYRNSWGRALAGTGICAVALWASAQITSAAPEYVFAHQKWLVAVGVALAVLAVVGLVATRRG
jgi:hypothetical protein